MKIRFILIGIFCMVLLAENVAAENPYGKIYTYDVYYNDKLLPDTDVAKPVLKIGEPFTVGINITVYQKSDVYVSLSCMEENSFVIINGPTLRIGRYSDGDVLEANSSKEYEWTVKPTERWVDGTLPLDIYYTILAHGNPKPLVNSGFTVAYPYISNEHYKSEAPTPKDQKVSETELPTSKSTSLPGFSIVAAITALALVFFRFSRH